LINQKKIQFGGASWINVSMIWSFVYY